MVGRNLLTGETSGRNLLAGSPAVEQPQDEIAQNTVAIAPQQMTTSERIADVFTGADRMTPEMEALGEIGNAPELNSMSWSAFKTSLGLLATGNEEKAKGIIQSSIPEAEFSADSAGNTIVNLPSGQYALNKPGVSPQDVAKGVFDIAAFTPAGRAATIPAAAAKSGATEIALQGTASELGGGDVDAGDVALAALFGAGGKAIEDAIGTAYRAVKGKIPDQATQVIKAGEDAGVPVMTSDILPPKTLAGKLARSTGEAVPFAGTGAARGDQQEMRQQAVRQFADRFQTPSYDDVVKSLKDKSTGVRQAAGNIYNKTSAKLDPIGDVPVEGTRAAIDDAFAALNKSNVKKDAGAIAELEEIKELMDMPQTFTSLKENRTAFRDSLDSFGKGDRSQLQTRAKAMLEKVQSGMRDDMRGFAKENLDPKEYASWRKAEAVYAAEAQKLKKTKIKNILDKGDVTPESAATMLFSNKPSEVKMLFSSLTTEGRQNARAALIHRAVDSASRRAGGLSPNSFSSELNKISKNTDVFFRGADKKQLEGFKRLIEATRRAQDAAVETPTGQRLVGAGAGYAAFTDLGATLGLGGTAGGLARMYESAPVRNALLKLGSVQKGSDQFLKALFEAQAALSASAQAARRGAEE